MKAATTLVLSLLLAAPVFADDAITVFGGGFTRDWVTRNGTPTGTTFTPVNQREWNGEVGLALSHALSPRWSAEASVALKQSHMFSDRWVPVGNTGTFAPAPSNARVRTIPVDLAMRYHLFNGSRWRPYVSAGARYVNPPDVTVDYLTATPDGSPVPVTLQRPSRRISAEAGAGLAVMLTPRFGLRADIKRLLRSDDSPFDPIERTTFGLEWKL